MIRIEVALNQSWMSWYAVIIVQVLIKIKFMLQATHLIICHPKWKIYENFQTAIPKNKQNMFIAILLSFFMIYFANFMYSELPNSSRGIFRALSNI